GEGRTGELPPCGRAIQIDIDIGGAIVHYCIMHFALSVCGGYDRNIQEPPVVYAEIDYMHDNPVRRGLCARPENWLLSGAADYAGIRHGPMRLDREIAAETLGRLRSTLKVETKGLWVPCPRLCVGMLDLLPR